MSIIRMHQGKACRLLGAPCFAESRPGVIDFAKPMQQRIQYITSKQTLTVDETELYQPSEPDGNGALTFVARAPKAK